jgi:hypothetical protein
MMNYALRDAASSDFGQWKWYYQGQPRFPLPALQAEVLLKAAQDFRIVSWRAETVEYLVIESSEVAFRVKVFTVDSMDCKHGSSN